MRERGDSLFWLGVFFSFRAPEVHFGVLWRERQSSVFLYLSFFVYFFFSSPPLRAACGREESWKAATIFSLIIQKREREFGRAVQNSKNNPKKCFSFSLWGESICFFVIRFSVSFSYTRRGMEEERQRKKEKRGSKEEEKETSKSLLVASSSSPSLSPSILTNAAFSRPPQESKK